MALRVLEEIKVLISEDNVSVPTEIKYQTDTSVVDTTSITECVDSSSTFPIGTTVVPLGNIAAGKVLIIKPTTACQVDIGGEVISLRANKRSIIWADFTAVSIIQALVTNSISILIGGD